jgi:hypothetical protein
MVRENRRARLSLAAPVLLVLVVLGAAAAEDGQLWSTWDGFEPDKCASVWLIKRHIDPAAGFRFYRSGTAIDEGIPFDTPDAELRRYHDASTFETLLRRYAVDDPKAAYLGRLLHDIEVNVWERKALAETRRIEHELAALTEALAPEEAVEACVTYFDGLVVPEMD